MIIGVAGRERVRDAVADVILEELHRDALQRGRHGGDLREDVDAVALVLDHPLDAPHLTLDAVQALDQRVLLRDVAVGHAVSPSVASRRLRKRRSRRLLVTTNRLELAIAAAATIGLSRPATASGIAATL